MTEVIALPFLTHYGGNQHEPSSVSRYSTTHGWYSILYNRAISLALHLRIGTSISAEKRGVPQCPRRLDSFLPF